LHRGSAKYLLVVKNPSVVRAAAPDFDLLKTVMARAELETPPLSVTITSQVDPDSREEEDAQVVSRHFAPWVGIDEDPVTGAAHVVLAPYWLNRWNCALTPGDSIRCLQASARSGWMVCRIINHDRIALEAHAVSFLSGLMSAF
jgi:predicted PhzF superfamily epimerase YddE/YHI9